MVAAKLQRYRLWEGPDWFASLLGDYATGAEMLALADNRIDPRWPLPVAVVALEVLAADNRHEAIKAQAAEAADGGQAGPPSAAGVARGARR